MRGDVNRESQTKPALAIMKAQLTHLSQPPYFLLARYDFRLQAGAFSQKGDTFFAFFVPAAAREDVVLLQQLIARGIITKRLAACLMMVDFANPVYSDHRRRLAQVSGRYEYVCFGKSDYFGARLCVGSPGPYDACQFADGRLNSQDRFQVWLENAKPCATSHRVMTR